MNKVILSGGSGSGRSTSFQLLKDKFPEAYFIHHAPRYGVKLLLNQSPPQSHLEQALKYIPQIIEQQRLLETTIPENSKLVIMDYSKIDLLGYLAYYGLRKDHETNLLIEDHVRRADYTIAFFHDRLTKYSNDIEPPCYAEDFKLSNYIKQAYADQQPYIRTVHLPAVTALERISLISGLI